MSTVTAIEGARRPLTAYQWVWFLLIVTSATCLYLLYAQPLARTLGFFTQPEYSHGYLIPVITGFFIWHRRHAILAERDQGSWWGVALALVAVLLLLLGRLSGINPLGSFSFVAALLALGFAFLGARSMRRAWLPILFLITAIPLPLLVFVWLSSRLQLISSQLGAWMLELVGVSVFVSGNVIDLGVHQLQVAEACAGLRYLFPLTAFAFLCAWLMRAPLWMRGVVLLSAVPLTIILNSARIAMTGLFIEYGSIELAEGFMHLFEGWVVFMVALAILFVEMWALCRLAGSRVGVLDVLDFDRINGPPAVEGSRPAFPPMAAFVAVGVLASGILVFSMMGNRDQYIPDRPGLATFPPVIGEWHGSVPRNIDQAVERILKSDDYLLVDYTRGSEPPVNLWVAYYGSQTSGSIHSPKRCLPGAGWEYVGLNAVDAPIDPSVAEPFKVNRGLIAHGRDQMLMYYWLDMRGHQYTNDMLLKLMNVYDSIVMGRSDGALVRLLTRIEVGETVDRAEERLKDFMANSYPHMLPHVGL